MKYSLDFKEWFVSEVKATSNFQLKDIYEEFSRLEKASDLDEAFIKFKTLPISRKRTNYRKVRPMFR